MAKFDVLLKFKDIPSDSPQEAGETVFEAFFRKSEWQPYEFDVISQETGSVEETSVIHLQKEELLYTQDDISRRLRGDLSVLVHDACRIEHGPIQGHIVISSIINGVIRVGDSLSINKHGKNIVASVVGIELNNSLVEEGYLGEMVGILFRGNAMSILSEGDQLVRHGA